VAVAESMRRGTRAGGLSPAEAERRLELWGPNEVPEPAAPSVLSRVARGLRDPLVLVLLAALLLTLLTRDFAECAIIGLVVVVNSVIGLHQELEADRSVRALTRLVQPKAWALRSGDLVEIPSAELVPGDLVLLRQGDLVPADAILVEGSGVQVDESLLTGESVPVGKDTGQDPGPDPPAVPTAEAPELPGRLVSGTVVVHGHGHARITKTGRHSTLGGIASLTASTVTSTPLQRRMARLSAQLAAAVVLLGLVVMVVGLSRGQPAELMVLTAIALVVAAVPESLPLVVTVSLALGARRMAARRAVVRDLAAVGTLGSVTLLATDKTGTLTRGSMSVADTWRPPTVPAGDLVRALVLCNDASLARDAALTHGDPTDSALLQETVARGADVEGLRAAHPRIAETPFDSTRKTMTTVHRGPGEQLLEVHKGAPERILADGFLGDDPALLAEAREVAARWGRSGVRVLAVAQQVDMEAPERQPGRPRLLGLVGLSDPVRGSSAETVAACKAAGIRVVLVTGDHAATAHAIATMVGIEDADAAPPAPGSVGAPAGDPEAYADASVVARATPVDKHALVGAYQGAGHVVAMTGDGVNDAPALRRADIGVAMGERGTEVARQAADLVLTDDNLATLVSAVEEGRRVYDNIRRFLAYGLSGGISEVLIMLMGPLVGIPLPLLPAQILWLNLLTHSFAGAGLAAQPADTRVMARGPRPPRQGALGGGLGWRTGLIAAYLAIASLTAALLSPPDAVNSAALLTLGAGQLAVAWGVRTPGSPVWRPGSGVDPLVPSVLTAGTMLVASTTIAPVRDLLATTGVGVGVWSLAVCVAVGAWLLTRLLRTGSV
jgi:P-type Ca2+ transporter type 2C